MKWITAGELAVIHARVIEETGGIQGIVNPSAMASAVARPFTAFGGESLFPTLADKVGAMIHSIIAFHPFSDGNKRTALVAADVCLRLNGLRLISSVDVEPYFWAIARGEKSVSDIAAWLGSRTEAWPH